ncbi:lytic transglycosylase domain-containing protein [Paracoccus sediminicola]|uniref:lytic transglycosylase domain-containing protein n=1 Tax=Paracoccus sediminicola TaxID=3017783 RepID=UPI0022F00218|nr:lytic transglycosylase domain-containing protein [Paracoccus sediminicola]WBU57557.1 lytic transglycosylase domain-containing protein [Paracoccus sediminicola]
MGNILRIAVVAALGVTLAACDSAEIGRAAVEAPTLAADKPGLARRAIAKLPGTKPLPAMRWDGKHNSAEWTEATLAALDAEGAVLMSRVPSDIVEYCPAYASQSPENRRAFWAGLLSALARHESSHNPKAKGAGGRYLGLMQISPATARGYGCDGALLNASDNMSCAVRIAAKQVARDNAIARSGGGWRGVARDWGPMRSSRKRAEIAAWTSKQDYCR